MRSEQIENEYDPSCCDAARGPVNLDVITSEGTRRAIPGLFLLFGGKSLIVNTSERISPATCLAAQYEDVLFVGEVCACDEETDRLWTVRINVKYTLTSLQSLTRLRSALLGSSGVLPDEDHVSSCLLHHSRRCSVPIP